ncbi:MAG: N-formylglutamate amidohydrolase [Acidobacteriota bacterium]
MTPVVLRPQAKGKFVILCDHASNAIPPELNNLGLSDAELIRHIAWDIGAAGITKELSKLLDSPAILSPVSRLVVDCNRRLDAATLIPEISDGVEIPGNKNLTAPMRIERIGKWFTAYHDTVETVLEAAIAHSVIPPIVLSVHSMTDNLSGSVRPWQISLSSHRDRSLVDPLLAALRRPGDITVGDNQPYDLDPDFDYCIPFHALRRNLPHIQVEFRQDEVGDAVGQLAWAERFAGSLLQVA